MTNQEAIELLAEIYDPNFDKEVQYEACRLAVEALRVVGAMDGMLVIDGNDVSVQRDGDKIWVRQYNYHCEQIAESYRDTLSAAILEARSKL